MAGFETVIEAAKAEVLPFESWERLTGESSAAFAAFCAYRDFGAERNIKRAAEAQCQQQGCQQQGCNNQGQDTALTSKRYRAWRAWSMQFKWVQRAADFDRYVDRMKQAELRKSIEEQGKAQRRIAGKMNQKVEKKIDLMDAADLSTGAVPVWLEAASKVDREAALLLLGQDTGERQGDKPGRITFASEFEGL
jgi:hypothetical protein